MEIEEIATNAAGPVLDAAGPVLAAAGPVLDAAAGPVLEAAGPVLDAVLPFTFATAFTALTLVSQQITNIVSDYPKNSDIEDCGYFDFIIVGGGTAGCVVANRLTEIFNWTVLLIVHGGDPPVTSRIPVLFLLLTGANTDYAYKAEKQNYSKSLINETIILSAGKMLGGGSSMSYTTANRGNEEDFNAWGPPEWKYDAVLPFMIKLETVQIPEIRDDPDYKDIHGENGPMNITLNNKIYRDTETEVINSMSTLGYDVVPDLNGRNKTGWSYTPLFISPDGTRTSTAEKYCIPASKRDNFYYLKNTRVTQILFDGNTATGVKVLKSDGSEAIYNANLEVISSAGVFESPKLLMLSGIGPEEELKKYNIDLLVDLPVGKNLKDPPKIPLPVLGKRGVASALDVVIALDNLNTVPIPTVIGELENNIEILDILLGAASPIALLGCIIVNQLKTEYCTNALLASLNKELSFVYVILHEPKSRGTVTIRSTDPKDDPIVTLNYFENTDDVEAILKAVKLMASITDTTPYYQTGEVVNMELEECKDFEFGTDDYYKCFLINTASSYLQPYGTCRMGDDGVVDANLKVHKVNKLRVIDNSIIPLLKRGETQYVSILIGERAADLIKKEYNVND